MPDSVHLLAGLFFTLIGLMAVVGGVQLRRRNHHLLVHGRTIRGVVTKLEEVPRRSTRKYRATVQYQPAEAAVHTVQLLVDEDCWLGAYLTLRYDPAQPAAAALDEDVKPQQELVPLVFGGAIRLFALLYVWSLFTQ